jgi:hypothetical protein
MCFCASTGIDGPTVNGVLLPVDVFAVLFDHFFLIIFLQKEANCKHDNNNTNENATKVCHGGRGAMGCC